MKKNLLNKQTFLIIFISILFIIPSIKSNEKCFNTSMDIIKFDKSNLDTHGKGAKTTDTELYLHKKESSDWNSDNDDSVCGFIFNKQIDFRKDVHIYLKNYLKPNIILDRKPAFDGFTIVIGKDKKNIVNKQGGEHLGYNDMTNIFVIEIDTHHNDNGDMNDDHIGYRNCFEKKCSSRFDKKNDDQKSIKKYFGNNYDKNKFKNYIYNIHLLYSYEKAEIKVYIGTTDTDPILTTPIDITKYMDNGMGYIAFSTFLRGYRRTENIYGSFVCSGISHSLTPTINISINNKNIDYSLNGFKIKANNIYNVKITYTSERDLIYDNIELQINSDTINLYTKSNTIKNYDIKASRKTGNYILNAKSAHETQKINYEIFSESPNYFEVYGKNLVEYGNKYYKKDGNTYTLKWGSLKPFHEIGGDFSYGDFVNNKTFSFIIKVFDEFDNEFNNNEDDNIIELLKIKISNSKNENIPLLIKRIKENLSLYEISFNITCANTYIISGGNNIPSTVKINIINNLPSPNSNCHINSDKHEFIQDENISYLCEIKNEDFIVLNPENIFDNNQINFKCELIGNNKTTILQIDYDSKYIYCNFTSFISGNFEFNIYYSNNNLSDTIDTKIISSNNKFEVYTIPMDISFITLFDYKTEKWYSNEEIKNTVFKYDTDDNFYYLLRLYESDKTTPYINEKNYNKMNVEENINGILVNSHTKLNEKEKECPLQFSVFPSENGTFIKMLLGDKSCLISSSFNYKFDINYKNTKLELNLSYLISNNTKMYCQHKISENNTYFELDEDTKNVENIVGKEVKVGSIYLKTICNKYYDYYLDNIENFTYSINNIDYNNESTKIEIKKDNFVKGKYDVFFQSIISNKYKYDLKLNNINIDNGSNNLITFVSEPIVYKFENSTYNKYNDTQENTLSDTNSDEIFLIYFKAFDKYSNQLFYDYKELQSSINLKIIINEEELTQKYKDKISIEYDGDKEEYYIKDNILNENGDFKLCLISSKNPENNLTYFYVKRPGVVSNLYITILNEYQIQIGENSTISVTMYDKNNNNIGNDIKIYEKELTKLTFIAVNNNNKNEIEYSYKKKEGTNAIFVSSSEIMESGLYTVKGFINGSIENVGVCSDSTGCEFDVVENNFNMDDSILYRLSGNNKIKMNENDYYIINKKYENLIFYFEFYNKNGQIVEYVDPIKTNIKAILSNNNNNYIYELENRFISNNGILFKYNFNNNLSNEIYNLTLLYNNISYNNYRIKIINEETNTTTYNIENTYIKDEKMFLIAGVYSYNYLELRDENLNPSLNDKIDISKFKIKSINSNEYLDAKFYKGSKLGTIIFDIKDNIQSSYNDNNIAEILYDGKQFRSINLIVNENIINKFKISKNCFKNNEENSLIDGEINQNYLINMVAYDEYDNIIKKFLFDENIFESEFIKNFFNIKSNYPINSITSTINSANNSITLIINTKYSDNITLSSSFLDKEYSIKINGNNNNNKEISIFNNKESESNEISFENSYLIIDNIKPSLNENINLYIYLYDNDNNYINPNKLNLNENESINLYHRFYYYDDENNLIPSDYNLINNRTIIEKDGIYVIKYTFELNKIGINNFIAFYNFMPIVCKNSIINVINTKNNLFSLDNSLLYKFDTDKNNFVLLEKDLVYISYNYKEKLLLKFVPKDKNNNEIKINDIKNIIDEKISFEFDNFSFEKEQFDNYIILSLSDYENYKNLEGKIYSLNINYEKVTKTFKINLSGPKTNEYFIQNNIDIQNTLISYEKLNIIAGNYGFISIDFRTENNFHYLGTDFKDINIKIENCNTNYEIYNNNSLPYLILITSNISNSFPIKKECELKTIINNKNINSFINIRNNRIKYAKINNNFIKEDFKLKDGNSDYYYNFSVKSYDEFNNEGRNNNNKLKINLVNEKNNNFNFKYNYINIIDGEQYYIYYLTKKGNYSISAGKNSFSEKDNLFENNYELFINNGEVSSDFTTVDVNHEIVAGDFTTMTINIKDKNSNSIPVTNEILNNFEVFAEIEDEKFLSSDSKIENNNLIFKTKLIKKGKNLWTIKYKSNILFQNIHFTNVIPNNFNCNKTLIYYYNESQNLSLYEDNNNTPIFSSKDFPLEIHLVFKDDYDNIIDTITDNTKINMSYLKGNNMQEIEFEDNINSYKNETIISLKEEDKIQFNHLVGRNNYTFVLEIVDENNDTNNNIFNLRVHHHTNTNDSEYGNGKYDASKTEFENNSIFFTTDEPYLMKFTLKTSENLIYNDFIDKNDIELSNVKDITFKYEISQDTRYGIYIIKFSSQKVQNTSVCLQIHNKETGSWDNTSNINIYVTVGIPHQNYTIYDTNITNESTTTNYYLSLTLADQYNNEYQNYDLEKIKNKIKLQFNSKNLDESLYDIDILDNNFIFNFIPIIPPRNITINAIYIDNGQKILRKDISSYVDTPVDFSKTKIDGDNYLIINANDTLDLILTFYDKDDICIETLNEKILLANIKTISANGNFEKNYTFEKIESNENCKYQYKLKMDENEKYNISGYYNISLYANETFIKSFIQKVNSGNPFSFIANYIKNNNLFSEKNIEAGSIFYINIDSYDAFNNKVTKSIENMISAKIKDNKNKEIDSKNYTINYSEEKIGSIKMEISIFLAGNGYNFEFYFENEIKNIQFTKGGNKLNVLPSYCINHNNNNTENKYIDYSNLKTIGENNEIIIYCYDKYDNKLLKGGSDFQVTISLQLDSGNIETKIDSKLEDNNNGAYTITFKPPMEAHYVVTTYLKILNVYTIYDEYEIDLKEFSCDKTDEIKCPNKNLCVNKNEIYKCVDENNKCTDINKPFYCKSRKNKIEECVESQTDCECPENYFYCEYSNNCVKHEYNCQFFLKINCDNPDYPILCDDGICRNNKKNQPSKKRCPFGYVLCADLSCQKSYDECKDFEYCGDNMITCSDQTCVSDQSLCPTTITCSNNKYVVCPDGKCVENEIYCNKLKECKGDTPYLCNNNVCAKDEKSCNMGIVCGHGKSLCEDFICRENCEYEEILK